MTARLGDQPIEAGYVERMNKLAGAIDRVFNGDRTGPDRTTGFVLMVFEFTGEGTGTDGRCNFISNGADRRDLVVLFKEMIARFEGQPEAKGHA